MPSVSTPGGFRDALDAVLSQVRADLERLVRIPSVSADPEARPAVEASAEEVARQLVEAGLPEVEVVGHEGGIEARMWLPPEASSRLLARRRASVGPVGCGLCGIDSLAWFEQEASLLDPRDGGAHDVDGRLEPAALHRAMTSLSAHQQLHHATGAAHAAGWAGWDGAIACVREDVGRHNALDKLIGALARDGVAPDRGFVVVTSRASFEMVQKAARAGIAILAAVSAPTASSRSSATTSSDPSPR